MSQIRLVPEECCNTLTNQSATQCWSLTQTQKTGHRILLVEVRMCLVATQFTGESSRLNDGTIWNREKFKNLIFISNHDDTLIHGWMHHHWDSTPCTPDDMLQTDTLKWRHYKDCLKIFITIKQSERKEHWYPASMSSKLMRRLCTWIRIPGDKAMTYIMRELREQEMSLLMSDNT